jgi:predicted PurR-regulated permease PerM
MPEKPRITPIAPALTVEDTHILPDAGMSPQELYRHRRRVFTISTIIVGTTLILWLAVMYWLSWVFTPVLIALALAYILHPAARWMERRGMSRPWAVRWVFLLLALAVGGLLAVAIPLSIEQTKQWQSRLPEARARVEKFIERTAQEEEGTWLGRSLEWARGGGDGADVERYLTEKGDEAMDAAAAYLARSAGTVLHVAVAILLIPFYTYYFLIGLPVMWTRATGFIPQSKRERAVGILMQIHLATSAFFRGRLLICAVVGCVTATGFAIGGVPLAIPMGLIVGAAALVPFLSIIVSTPIFIMAWADSGDLAAALLGVGIPVLIGPIVLDTVLMAVVLSRRREIALHAVTIVISLFLFGAMFGFVGLLLAVPIAATSKILARELLLPHFRRVAET